MDLVHQKTGKERETVMSWVSFPLVGNLSEERKDSGQARMTGKVEKDFGPIPDRVTRAEMTEKCKGIFR